MRPKQILGWAIIAFILYYIITSPVGAAHGVDNIGSFLNTVGTGFAHFFSSL